MQPRLNIKWQNDLIEHEYSIESAYTAQLGDARSKLEVFPDISYPELSIG